MSRDDTTPPTEAPSILRTQGMNEVLPRHDLDLFTSARMFPDGDWMITELDQRHQFQAAYCVPNHEGQLVLAPMAPVNVSAVTNEDEIYQHCTVYRFAPSYQRRGDTEHFGAGSTIGQQTQHHDHGLPLGHGNYQQVPHPTQGAEQYHPDQGRKHHFIPQIQSDFFAAPPAYTPVATTNPQAPALDKGAELPPAQMQAQNFIGFPGESALGEYSSHQEPSVGTDSFVSTSFGDSFRHSPGETHGLSTLTLQEFNPNTHEPPIIPSNSFGMTFSPAMMSQLDDQAMDELFIQSNNTGRETPEGDQRRNEDDDDIYSDAMPAKGGK